VNPLTQEKMLTYGEWKAIGMQVAKGERARGRNAKGVPVFAPSQVIDPGEADPDEMDAWAREIAND